MERQALLAFTVSGRRLALPLDDVRRIVPLPLLETPLGAPKFLEGFFDFRGTPVAALRLDHLLSLGDGTFDIYSPLLVLREADPPVALHVSRVTGIIKAAAADIQPIGKDETFNACVVGRVGDRGETVYLLSTRDILLAEERGRIVSHRTVKQQRLDALAGDLPGELAHAS